MAGFDRWGESFLLGERGEQESVWWTTSNRAPKSGYSFLSVLKQWGQVVMILRTPPCSL